MATITVYYGQYNSLFYVLEWGLLRIAGLKSQKKKKNKKKNNNNKMIKFHP